MSEPDTLYHLWLAAVARGNANLARSHAEQLRACLRAGQEPSWSSEARASFYAWCDQSRARRNTNRM